MPTTILLVDDHPVFSKGIQLLLEQDPDLRVVGEASDGQAAIDRVRDLSPDVAVMDITMPNLNGIDATRRIVTEFPRTKVIALSIHSGKRFVEDMLSAGAAGYILKETVPEELINGIKAVIRGEVYLSAAITGIVVSQYVNVLSGIRAPGETAELTAREKETLQLIVEGNSTKQIASVLQVAPKTVESTRRRIMEKLGVNTAVELTEVARHGGLIEQAIGPAMADHTAARPIIFTKLHRPPLPGDYVHRPQLLKQLDEGRRLPLSLVSAPAGYGKSTLVSNWLENWDCPSAWVSLDEDDNDLHLFLNYFIHAIQTALPEKDLETQALLSAPTLPPVSVLTRYLLNDLDDVDETFILVLDDYHLIHETAVHDLLTELLRHPPSAMHLVLLTRRDPPLPISTLRARGQLTEIAVPQLRFTPAETQEFLEKVLKESVDKAAAAILEQKTEGWVTGLRLASLTLKDRSDLDRIAGALKEGLHYITDYLVTEALSQQPPVIANYMMETSILDRFCPSLCEALHVSNDTGGAGKEKVGGQEFVEWLEKANLFVIHLDETHQWFRYHHLFQQLLQSQLKRQRSPEEIAALHARAGRWFAENGLIEDALEHALAADDIPFAVQLVEKHRHHLMNGEQWHRMKRILGVFPDQVVETHPELVVMKAWILHHLVRFPEMAAALDRAESLIAAIPSQTDTGNRLGGEIDAMRGNQFYFEADGQRAMSSTQQALDRLPLEHTSARGQAALIHCTARQMIGDSAGALEMAHGLIAEDTLQNPAFDSRRLFSICFVYWIEGDIPALRQIADQLLKHSQKWHLPETMSGANYFLGIVCYLRNDMTSAEKHLAHAVESVYVGQALAGIQSCFALSLVYQSQGRTEKAREAAESAFIFASEIQNRHGIILSRAFEAELALRQGRLNEAIRWARQFSPEPFRSMPWFYVPQLTLARVLMAQASPESLQQAADLLDRLHDFVVSIHNTRFRIDVLALQALLHDGRGEEPAALEKLTESLALAEPGGFIRNFVDLGPPMADLLNRLLKKGVAVDYIGEILAAFRGDEQLEVPEVSDSDTAAPHPPVTPSIRPQPLVEPLTNRELDILELLEQRLQTKEIAEKRFISPETVKSHLKNIYQKLNASNRREAVDKAKKIGIL